MIINKVQGQSLKVAVEDEKWLFLLWPVCGVLHSLSSPDSLVIHQQEIETRM